jgi:carbohydrate kinase (thermoresistant glucokinase family)
MGISGSGKTTIGQALARRMGCRFQEGDDLHQPESIEKMRLGHPLDDADREPWLERVAAWLAARGAADEAGVISCSALKHRYRDRIRRSGADVRFVFLDPPETTLRQRITGRSNHFIPLSLLESQIETLERPDAAEQALRLTGEEDVETQCDQIHAWLKGQGDVSAAEKEAGDVA